MSIADWDIRKENGVTTLYHLGCITPARQASTALYRKRDSHHRVKDAGWICTYCDAIPPKEICGAADLCGCLREYRTLTEADLREIQKQLNANPSRNWFR